MRFMPSLCHVLENAGTRLAGTAENGNARLATDDIATEVGRLRDESGDGVVSIGGAGLAAAAIAGDLIDEYRLFVNPVILGGGTPYFTPLTKPSP
jgi:dihydrofolate reductase